MKLNKLKKFIKSLKNFWNYNIERWDILKFVINRDGPKILFPWNYIGSGMEAKVYRKGDTAYKCYHFFSACTRLNLEQTKYLEQIQTQRILMPQQALYNCLAMFRGYTTTYIEDLGLLHLMNLPTDVVLENFHLLQEDCKNLAQHKIVLADLAPKDFDISNHAYHYGIYFFDPGRYHQDSTLSLKEVITKNQAQVDEFIYFRMFCRYLVDEVGREHYHYGKLYQLKEIMSNCPGEFMNYIEDDIHEDTLGEYIKRKVL